LTRNSGTISGADPGTLKFEGGLTNTGTVDLTGNGTPGDQITIGGAGLSGTGTFALDLDLRNDVGGLGDSDLIVLEAGAPVTGSVQLAFSNMGIGGEQANDIPVLDVDEGAANNFTVSATGIPNTGEAIVYALSQDGSNGDVFIVDLLNPGVGVLAGNIVLTQSLIGSIINRPSSPFVNGLILGFNDGSSTQPIFALDPDTGLLSDTITSVTDVGFFQSYAGIYGTAVRDRFAAELQYRVERTDFEANNVGQNGAVGLGLTNSTFQSNSNTFSGSVSYALDIPNTELLFVPVGGFAYTQVETDPIVFDDGSVVQVLDFDSRIGFVGGTVSRTSFGEDGTTALNQFVTATYYNDFADDPLSSFDPGDGSGLRTVRTQNLGSYTELSVGVNYIKILDVKNPLNVKQLSASARADARVSDQLESWGLTAQVRFQF